MSAWDGLREMEGSLCPLAARPNLEDGNWLCNQEAQESLAKQRAALGKVIICRTWQSIGAQRGGGHDVPEVINQEAQESLAKQ